MLNGADAQQRCERMRRDPIFQELLGDIKRELLKPRQALSHHTTVSCQLTENRPSAPLASLRAAGMDTPFRQGPATP
jgi:hypothetical protein